MRIQTVLLLSACLLVSACKKKAPEPAPEPSTPAPVAEAAPVAADPGAPAPEVSGTPAASLHDFQASPEYSDLNSLVAALYGRNKRLPTLTELAQANGRPLPAPPVGYKLVIDPQTKTVKAVPGK